MKRLHPISPLFPYTTLFRSLSSPAVNLPAIQGLITAFGTMNATPSLQACASKLGDRKSTRLNSSHRCISYAVFRLKKKNRNKDVKLLGSGINHRKVNGHDDH